MRFIDQESSILCSKEASIVPYPKTIEISPLLLLLCLVLPLDFFLLGVPNHNLYTFHIFYLRDTNRLMLLDLLTLMVLTRVHANYEAPHYVFLILVTSLMLDSAKLFGNSTLRQDLGC